MARSDGRVVSTSNGMIQKVYTDSQTGRTVLETAPDNKVLRKLYDETTAVRNSIDERARWGEGDMVATIPPALQWQLMKNDIWPGPSNGYDPRPLKKWLNDPDNRAWRLRSGRI